MITVVTDTLITDSKNQSLYSLSKSGVAFAGASTDVKRYIWNSICAPVLTYGLDNININVSSMKNFIYTSC